NRVGVRDFSSGHREQAIEPDQSHGHDDRPQRIARQPPPVARAEQAGRSPDHVSPRRMATLVFGTFAVGVYGGYFTAAQGILLVGLMGALLPESVQRTNAAKNLLALMVNVVAAIAYTAVAFDRISWPAAGLIAAGSLVGGLLGARYGRRLSGNALRAIIVAVGLIGLYRLLAVT
ncbi:sulfite exporter TauE/SafE family protein, partial [Mycobacterium sp. 1482292.6]|uniref:sulfite exporter TauE/SafE family protein n=1 Tax=Mycobacterium sp. 1482292.6 TaxID=1834081 RepID=UPI001E4EAAB6